MFRAVEKSGGAVFKTELTLVDTEPAYTIKGSGRHLTGYVLKFVLSKLRGVAEVDPAGKLYVTATGSKSGKVMTEVTWSAHLAKVIEESADDSLTAGVAGRLAGSVPPPESAWEAVLKADPRMLAQPEAWAARSAAPTELKQSEIIQEQRNKGRKVEALLDAMYACEQSEHDHSCNSEHRDEWKAFPTRSPELLKRCSVEMGISLRPARVRGGRTRRCMGLAGLSTRASTHSSPSKAGLPHRQRRMQPLC